MPSNLFLYPTLNDSLRTKITYHKKQYEIFYDANLEILKSLEYEPSEINSDLNCIKTDGVWNPNDFNIVFTRISQISNYEFLFGKDGLVCKDAKIGIAIAWASQTSRQRGSVVIKEFGYPKDKETLDLVEKIKFDKGLIRGDLAISTILYVAAPGNPSEDEIHLANQKGYVLGELDVYKFRIDGTASLFPIYEVFDKSKPLWYVVSDWVDPLFDQFSDKISICLNKAHKDYKYIDRTNNKFCNALFVEVMSSALCCIIETARFSPYWNQMLSDDEADAGSVADAIRYFNNTLGWDLSSPINASISIREFFNRRLKIDED